MNYTQFGAAAFMSILLSSGGASAAVIYNEAVDGDATWELPGENLGVLSLGSSDIIGSMAGSNNGDSSDWFEFTIAPGTQLDAVILTEFSASRSSGGNLSFSSGGSLIESNRGPYTAALIGTDLLESSALDGVPSFLGAGTYSMKSGTGTNSISYRWSFQVSSIAAVPVPASLPLLLGALGLFGFASKRKRRDT